MTINKPLAFAAATLLTGGIAAAAALTNKQTTYTPQANVTNHTVMVDGQYADTTGAGTFAFIGDDGKQYDAAINDPAKVAAQNEYTLNKMLEAGLPADHYEMLKAVADAGVLLYFNLSEGQTEYLDGQHCGADMMEIWGVEGNLGGWYDSVYNEMSLCDDGNGFDKYDLHILRHEVAHFLQDVRTNGHHRNADMATFNNVRSHEFQSAFAQVDQAGQDYANSYCEIGNYEACALEQEAEVVATHLDAIDLAQEVRHFAF